MRAGLVQDRPAPHLQRCIDVWICALASAEKVEMVRDIVLHHPDQPLGRINVYPQFAEAKMRQCKQALLVSTLGLYKP